jgi:hypothetical protein
VVQSADRGERELECVLRVGADVGSGLRQGHTVRKLVHLR